MTQNSTLAVRTKNLVKQYKGAEKPSVDDLNLEIINGEIFGLLGPNGAGKTTTISMISGLLKPTTGKIDILGKSLAQRHGSARRLIGLVPQEIALYPTLTAQENLMYFARMYGLPGDVAEEKIDELLNRVGLDRFRYKRIHTYSGGMKRRINLLASILHDPMLLILDEPTVGIDVQSRTAILEFLKELNEKGMTILYTSHHLDEAEDFCSHISIIDEGKIIASGTPVELIGGHEGVEDLEDLFIELTGKSLRD